jgi:hypothetical protein
VDEFAHLPAGCALLAHGTFWHYGHNPPLAKAVMALPAVLSGAVVPMPERLESEWSPWIYGERFMDANRERYFDLFFRARMAALAIFLSGGLLAFAFARALFGDGGGLAALFLWVFCPNLAAHGRLVTLDVPVAVAILGALYALHRAVSEPRALRLAVAGLALGAAVLVKFTSLLALPVAAILLGLADAPRGRRLPTWVLRSALVFGAALLAIDAGYLFRGLFPRLDALPLRSGTGTAVARALPGWLPIPLPRELVLGLDAEKIITERGEFGTYLAGRWWTTDAPRHYEIAALVLKTPLAMLVLAALALTARRPRELLSRNAAFVWLPPLAILLGLTFLSELKTGVRYVLPVVPFLFLGIASLVPRLKLDVRAALGALCALSLAVSTLRVHPHELSFFSALAGGTARGSDWLLDSNVDWGQDLSEAASWLRANGVARPYLLYFGHVDPSLYGIEYELPPPVETAGTYLVSLDYAKGASYVAPDHGRTVRVSGGAPAWLRERPYDEMIGTSIRVYRVGAR